MLFDLTSKISAKSERIAISRLNRTRFMPLLVMSRSSCMPPLINRLMTSPSVRSGMIAVLGREWLDW